jgi:hypothetical protein
MGIQELPGMELERPFTELKVEQAVMSMPLGKALALVDTQVIFINVVGA